MTTRPDLRGTWKGELECTWVSPDTKEKLPKIEVYLVIRQTFTTLDVRLFSAESSSISLAASVFSDKVGLYTLATAYRNTPTLLRRSKSPISHGGLLVSVRGNPVHQLDGEYWTDRYTMGEVKFTAKIRPQCHEFDEARKHKYDVIAN